MLGPVPALRRSPWKRVALGGAGVIVGLVLLSAAAGFADGPIGPFAGGPLSGTVDPTLLPDWSEVPDVIELQIAPARPWSLHTYAIPLDGELYVPSFLGPYRRWPRAALRDPRIVVRMRGRLYERELVRITDPMLCGRLAAALAARQGYAADGPPAWESTWYFHVARRSTAPSV